MCQFISIIFLLVAVLDSFCNTQPPAITYASSFYKTSAGAIGPSGIVATTTYDISINSHKTIILDSAVISGLRVLGDGIIIPTNKEGTMQFRIAIATHQQEMVWYTGALALPHSTVSVKVHNASAYDANPKYPAIVLYLRTGGSNHTVIKEKFDQAHSQYNK